jgi:mono/diheme cytochrome c family protein
MNDDVRKTIYTTLILFVFGVLAWVGFIFFNACGLSASCPSGVAKVERTSMPTLIPATLPALDRFVKASVVEVTPPAGGSGIARPSNPGGPGPAVELTGNADAGKLVFEQNCTVCHVSGGVGGHPNPGSADGTIPALNPIDETLKDADYKTFATNLDLFLEHGSTPEGNNPVFQMPAWGDKKLISPQQIADVIAYLISLNSGPVIARPSNPGEPGPAVELTGNADAGKLVFEENCVVCHMPEGVGGHSNPGSTDGTIPALNPIDETLKDSNYKTFATNLDLFIEHGSTPAGNNPVFQMPPWGDGKLIAPQQIADVIAYIISLNP